MIPVIDWQRIRTDRAAVVEEVGEAFRTQGFIVLRHPDVSAELRAKMFEVSDAFFAQPTDKKQKVSILNTPHFRGWGARGDESLDETRPEVDTKETFNVGLDLASDDPRVLRGEPFRGLNQWPDVAAFRETMLAYYDAAQAQGLAVLSLMAEDLGLPVNHFDTLFKDPLSALRVLRYPPASGAANEIGAGAHTDYGAITLLMTDGEPGLQVRPRGGDWIDVPHIEDAYVVNIGDCMMRWSNDIYVSTPHRVLPPKKTRRSVAFFVEANPDTIVSAFPGTGEPKYPPIRAADYLQSRLDATYAPKEAT